MSKLHLTALCIAGPCIVLTSPVKAQSNLDQSLALLNISQSCSDVQSNETVSLKNKISTCELTLKNLSGAYSGMANSDGHTANSYYLSRSNVFSTLGVLYYEDNPDNIERACTQAEKAWLAKGNINPGSWSAKEQATVDTSNASGIKLIKTCRSIVSKPAWGRPLP